MVNLGWSLCSAKGWSFYPADRWSISPRFPVSTGQFILNQEAGHFLYIVLYTAQYIQFSTNKNLHEIQGGQSQNH